MREKGFSRRKKRTNDVEAKLKLKPTPVLMRGHGRDEEAAFTVDDEAETQGP